MKYPGECPPGTQRSDRWWYTAALAVVLGGCWAYLIFHGAETQGMAAMSMPGDAAWSLEYGASMFVMWAVMIVAMMLPSVLPLLLVFRRLGATRNSSAVAVVLLAAGYLAMWITFAVLATLTQWYLHERVLLSPAMATASRVLAGTLLIAAGVYQWTPAKDACLRRCASPLQFLTMHWQGGNAGAWRMGVAHGAWCVGCCWLLMALLFVGGVMNLVWIVGIAAYILVEKMLPPIRWSTRGSGLGLIAAGIVIVLI